MVSDGSGYPTKPTSMDPTKFTESAKEGFNDSLWPLGAPSGSPIIAFAGLSFQSATSTSTDPTKLKESTKEDFNVSLLCVLRGSGNLLSVRSPSETKQNFY